jgi:hypothetical protein
MTKSFFRPLIASLLLGSATLAAACSVGAEFREITAERIARPAFMVERRFETGGMEFQTWERMHERFQPANIYIEGDGDPTYLNRDVTIDSTPENPVALHLASRDNADNLGYISRPCMYKEVPDKDKCDSKFYSTRRYSPEVIAAYNAALDNMKNLYDISEFNLIGYDGAANIVAALAAERKDVASIRTVAGNLNTDVVYAKTGQVLDADNVTAFKLAPQLSTVPQHHYIGIGDEVTPPSVYHSFRQEMGPSNCVHYTVVQDADHERGWVEKWPELLKATTECEVPPPPAPLPPRPIDKDASHGQK